MFSELAKYVTTDRRSCLLTFNFQAHRICALSRCCGQCRDGHEQRHSPKPCSDGSKLVRANREIANAHGQLINDCSQRLKIRTFKSDGRSTDQRTISTARSSRASKSPIRPAAV